MSAEQRFDLVISGKVQGVGYRYSVKHKAESLGISGFVRNQNDGSGLGLRDECFVQFLGLGFRDEVFRV